MTGRLMILALAAASIPSAHASESAAMTYAVTRTSGSYQGGTELVTPNVIVPVGGQLTFANVHIWGHAIYSETWMPGKQGWQRLFNSEVIPFGETSLVRGVDALAPGEYPFFCANHMGMRGTLVVTPAI